MELHKVRIFIGNLPPNVTIEDVQTKVKKYVNISNVELKHGTAGSYAFVDLCDSSSRVDKCFNKLSSKSWKGNQLRVEKAKESFLQRLAKERLENQGICSSQSSYVCTESIPNSSNSRCDVKDLNIESPSNGVNNHEDLFLIDKNKPFSSSSDSGSKKKGNLCMFSGTPKAFQNQTEESEQIEVSHRMLVDTLDEEKEILTKFERFDSTWKDTDSVFEENDVPVSDHKKATTNRLNSNNKKLDDDMSGLRSKVNTCQEWNLDTTTPQLNVHSEKFEESEKRRLKAINDRQIELLKRKQAIKSALASVDIKRNNKIIFDDDEVDDESESCLTTDKSQKLSLFNEDNLDCETNYDNDFRIKKQFEGEKGKSLLKLQARYGNDKRFTLDERFLESDHEEDKEVSHNVNESDRELERQKVLEVLRDVVGKDIKMPRKVKEKTIRPMLRYDPSKPDHIKFEVKKSYNETKATNEDKREKLNTKSAVANDLGSEVQKSNESSEVENPPVVSKEKFYHVTDSLKKSLQNKGENFSLLEVFGDEVVEEKVEEVPLNLKEISQKTAWSFNPFKDDSSASEDEMPSTLSEAKRNKKGEHDFKVESLFFKEKDCRFKEGLEFFEAKNEEYLSNFLENRRTLASKVTKKLQIKRRRAVLQNTNNKLQRRRFNATRRSKIS